MIIYKDRVTGDEMLSDIYKLKLVDGIYFEVEGKFKTESTTVDESMYGGNASAEGGDEQAEDASRTGVDIVLAHKLEETGFANKKDFQTIVKAYSQKALKKIREDDPDKEQGFKDGMKAVVDIVRKDFKEWQFFRGESNDPDGMLVFLNWREEVPYMLFVKDAMIEEKV